MKPNILFILVDGLRADKCYGDKKTSITPNIDSLIRKGTYFSQAISSSPSTIPSISNIFTGLYPFECMIHDDKVFTLNPKTTTYIKTLIDYGYSPYATFPEIMSFLGMDKIFNYNVDPFSNFSKLWNGLGQQIIDKLSSKELKEPWLYYLHLYDLRLLMFPNEYRINEGPKEIRDEKYGINQYERVVSTIDIWIGKILKKLDLEKTLIILTADHGHESGAYSAETEKFNDLQGNLKSQESLPFKLSHKIATKSPNFLKPLRKKLSKSYIERKMNIKKSKIESELEKIDNQDLRPYEKRIRKIVVNKLANLYDDRLRVPLIFSGFGIPSGKIISQQVTSSDIFPTIYEIVGLSNVNDGKRGQGLLPLLHGKKLAELPSFAEDALNSPKSESKNVVGIRTSRYKYFRNRINATEDIHLFDLINDPLEEYNIAKEKPEIVEEMEDILAKIQRDKNFSYSVSKKILSEESSNKALHILRKLGYIN